MRHWIKQILIYGALFSIAIGICVASKRYLPYPNIFDSVVKIEVIGIDGKWRGSGIFIRDNIILTAGHMVNGVELIDITLKSGEVVYGKSWYFEDPNLTDLGIIVVDTKNVEPTIKFSDAKIGESVDAIGNPFGYYPYVTRGIVSALSVNEDFFGCKNLLMVDCPLNPGNSGCPIINFRDELVGIAVGGMSYSDGIGFVVPAKICEAVLEKYLAIQELERLN
jgi:serine protease Do